MFLLILVKWHPCYTRINKNDNFNLSPKQWFYWSCQKFVNDVVCINRRFLKDTNYLAILTYVLLTCYSSLKRILYVTNLLVKYGNGVVVFTVPLLSLLRNGFKAFLESFPFIILAVTANMSGSVTFDIPIFVIKQYACSRQKLEMWRILRRDRWMERWIEQEGGTGK